MPGRPHPRRTGARPWSRPVAVALVGGLVAAAPAAGAGDPTMPLRDVKPGMQCTGRTVLHGTTITPFQAVVIDTVDGQAGGEDARILMRFPDPAIQPFGIAEGFSGSPVYCPDAHGVQRVIGAVSEGIGEYGNDKALVTPIAQVLAQSPNPPAGAKPRARRPGTRSLDELTMTGIPPSVAGVLERAARKVGRNLVVTSGGPAAGRFVPQNLVPGASVSAGYADGDYSTSAIGTVTYRDGDTVWAFGHPLDAVGRRTLFLQDAYVYDVIDEPDPYVGSSYKLAAPGHDLGMVTGDGNNAIAGRLGAGPPEIRFTLRVRDADTGKVTNTSSDIADETDLGNPAGQSALDFVAPAAVAGEGSTVLGGASVNQSGSMCFQLSMREWPKPIKVCNRYVATGSVGQGVPNPVAATAGQDVGTAVLDTETPTFAPLHLTKLAVQLTQERGLRKAFIRSVSLPKRVHPGQRVRVALRVQRYHGGFSTRRFTVQIPPSIRPGTRNVTFA
ncbi:MAG TPA: hypothetical protein VGI54_10700, partial [Solirubrobacteraceae bacterium]